MAKFTFPMPGRKKQQVQTPVTEPMTKAHKILGTAPLNIDSPRSWEGFSGRTVDVSEPPTPYDESHWPEAARLGKEPAQNDRWAEESAILPPRLKIDYTGDAILDYSESSTALRNKPSSSTIKSWYDKSKMPLAITQQTSASAMAKGLPPKAHKMLDMDNAHTTTKAKKPARLDFSSLVPSSRNLLRPIHGSDGDGFLFGSDQVTKSPSVLSSISPVSARRLRKRPTREGLSSPNPDPSRPTTGGSGSRKPKDTRFDELPGLYEHYEQMSFRQVLNQSLEENDDGDNEVEDDRQSVPSEVSEKADQILLQPRRYQEPKVPNHLAPPPPHPILSKAMISPASDCAASISSGHTRTSKASAAARSFQDSDLQETSMLMLSSDSEDDEYLDQPLKSPQSSKHRRGSGVSESIASSEPNSYLAPRPPGSTERRLSRSNKRASFATNNTYLTIPSRRDSHMAFYESGTTTGSVLGLQMQSYSSAISVRSNSSANSEMWQTRSDSFQEVHSVPMRPAHGSTDESVEEEVEEETPDLALARRESAAAADQPTPPLSPSSVDFYIRSAHSSIDGPGNHNHFMAVTHQEQMLLSALRQKRQIMRGSRTDSQESEDPTSKHCSNASEMTITESKLNFDFPLPPSFGDSAAKQFGMRPLTPQRNHSIKNTASPRVHEIVEEEDDEADATIHSPHPTHPPTWRAIFYKDFDVGEDDDAYNDSSETPSPHRPGKDAPVNVQDPAGVQQRTRRGSSRSSITSSGSVAQLEDLLFGQQRTISSRHRGRVLGELDMGPSLMSVVVEDEDDVEELGIPRPDSPVSPSCFPTPPTMTSLQKKMARLSAVGPAPPSTSAEW